MAGGTQPAAREGYRLTDPERIIGTGGPKARFARNKLALETYDNVLSENRPPTKEEQDILAAYIGWGSFGQELFQGSWDRPNPKPEFKNESEWLRDHLGKEGWESIRDSIINAHYTDPPHVQALWRIVEHLGFKGGRVLEPSMGIGSFFGLMPDVLRAKSSLTGIELDRVVGGMAQMLYPDANIRIMGYEKSATADGFYDLVIGNWPFAKDGPSDPRYNSLGLSLHDYFFVKALDQTRPGGLVIGITSSGTMDKKGQTARRQMARRAELVAAFRFPSGAFEKYAGTSVVTDVVILKRREEDSAGVDSDGWINTEEFGTGNEKFTANEYWRKNPSNVLGEMTFGNGTTQGRAGMIVNRQPDYQEVLATIETRLPKDILTAAPARKTTAAFQNRQTTADQNSVVWNDGDATTPAGFYVVRGEQIEPIESIFKWELSDSKKTDKRRDELKQLLGIRESVQKLLGAQRDGSPDTETIRKEARTRYEAFAATHGPIAKSFMVKVLTKAADPMALTLENMERKDGKKFVPREILLKDIMRRPVTDAKGSIEDAFAIQRNQSTELDVDAIAEISGKPVAAVVDRLLELDQIYKTPAGKWESREEYLGGNVRRKLREAKDAKSQGIDMDRNIDALEKIQPKDVAYFEIEVQMGASWIPREVYEEFAADLLGGTRADVQLTKAGSGWDFKLLNERLLYSTNATSTWGTNRIRFNKVFQAAMNGTTVKVYDTNSDGVKHLNNGETELANKKIDDIREELSRWLWSDPERTGKLSADYNEVMNSEVVPQRSGSHLRFEGLALTLGNSEFDFRQHQKDAVWRFIMDGRGVGAHEVGTGKTFTMAGLAVEGRRLGRFRKSLVFAHNANAESVFRDFQAAYPGGKFLFIDNLSPSNRDNAMRQIATDEWDAVVVPHSLIDRFALREETLMQIAAKEIQQMESEIADALDELGVSGVDINDEEDVRKKLGRTKDSHTAKELVKARNRIIKRIKDKAAKGHKDNAVFFEDLGVDSIMVDEAHMFKKIALATRKEVKGLNKTESERGWMLGALTDTIKSRNNGKGVFLFTGTPLTNNLNEAYNMMRFVMDDTMADAGIDGFDDWFNSFAASVTDVELTTGGTFEPVTRLLSFINVPELARLAGRFFDVVLAKNMPEFVARDSEDGKSPNAIGRPFKKVRPITSEMSEGQKAHKLSIQKRYKEFQALTGKDKRRAMLDGVNTPIQLETEGIKAALDLRMVFHGAADNPDSKVNMMLRNAIDHYTEDETSTQMIFMEQGWNDYTDAQVAVKGADGQTMRDSEGKKITEKVRRRQFNLVRDMVEKLVAKGVRPEEIAIFSNMSLDPMDQRPGDVLRQVKRVSGKVTKEDLAAEMRVGKIRFAIGSTQTMGTGVNAQTKLRAMHHLDAPWTPGEFEQRNGRGHRQGNEWNTVFEYRYFTEGSHDGRRWQVLLNKVKFISRFTEMLISAGGSDLRVLTGDGADLGEEGSNVSDFEQSFSTAAGDPRVLVRAKLRTDVEKLERKRDAHLRSISRAQSDIVALKRRKVAEAKTITESEELIESIAEIRERPFTVKIGGKTYAERKDAEEVIAAYPSLTQRDDDKEVMTVQGVPVFHEWYQGSFGAGESRFYAKVPIKSGKSARVNMGKLSLSSLESNLRGQSRLLANQKESFDTIDASVASLEDMIQKPFTRQPELDAKTAALQQIEVELNRAPQPAPAWLRNGAPVGSLVYLEDGKAYDVAAHRWDENGYWILVEDASGMRPVNYRKALDDSKQPMFEEVAFTPPETRKEEDANVSDDTAAFGQFIDEQEGRGLQAAPLSPSSLRDLIVSAFNSPPSSYEYQPSDENRPTVLEIARVNGLTLVTPKNHGASTRRIQSVYGVTVSFYEGGSTKDAGFVSGKDIFINSRRNDIPVSWTLIHELTHVAQKDSNSGIRQVDAQIGALLTDFELKAIEDRLLSQGYRKEQLPTEIQAFLVADAVTDGDVFGFDNFARGGELKKSLVDWFDAIRSLNPTLLKESPDKELATISNASRDAKMVRILQKRIDRAYETGKTDGVEEFEAKLETLLERIDTDSAAMDAESEQEFDSATLAPGEDLVEAWLRWTGRGQINARDMADNRAEFPNFGQFYRSVIGDGAFAVQDGISDEQIEEAARESADFYEARRSYMKGLQSAPLVDSPMPADDRARAALDKNKQHKFGALRGKPPVKVSFRLDLPSANRGTPVVSIHEPGIGTVIAYDTAVHLRDVRFRSRENEALKIRDGKAKSPMAAVEGTMVAVGRGVEVPAGWSPIRYNPKVHSYFFTADGNPVVSADEAMQIGGRVYAKGMVHEDPAKFLFAAPLSDSETPENIRRLTAKGRTTMADAETEAEARRQQEAFADQGKVIGTPRLANMSDDESVRAAMDRVDEMRKFTVIREKKTAWERKGRSLADGDESGEVENWLMNAFSDEGQAIKPENVVAIRIIMERRVKTAGNDLDKHADNAVLLHGYREARANQARVLAAGTDPFKNPEERYRDYLAGVIYELPPRVIADIEDRSRTPAAAREAIRKAVRARLETVEKALKKLGVTLDEITGGQVFLSLSQTAVMKDTLARLTPAEKTAVKAIQAGGTVADVRRKSGLSDERIQALAAQVRRELADKLRAKVAAGLKLEDLKDEMKGLRAAPLSPADIEAELERILTVGFGIPEIVPTARLPKKKRTKPVPLERMDWKRPVFTDALASFDFDTKDRSEIMARVVTLRDIAGADGRIATLTGDKKAKAVRLVGEINRVLSKYSLSADKVLREGTDPDSYRFDITDRVHVMILARTIRALDADIVDKGTEYFYSSILSGLQTMMVNATGALNSVWQATVDRGVEAAINVALKDPQMASLGEVKYMLKAMGPMLSRAWSNAQATWAAETPFFDEDILGRTPDLIRMQEGTTGYKTGSISGTKGRIIRIPGRILMATDDFMNTARAVAEVGAMAYRFAISQKLKPGTPEFDKVMKQQVNVPGSEAWQMAAQRALVGTFNNALPGQRDAQGQVTKIRTLTDLAGGAIYGLTHSKWLQAEATDGLTVKLLKTIPKILFFPFVRVPFNILKQGIERSVNPIVLFGEIAPLLAHNIRIRDGRLTMNADGDKARIMELVAKQVQGAFLMILLAALGEGDDDDLEKTLIVTGSRPFGDTKKGERELGYRIGLGPYEISMKLPNGKRVGFSYGRIEPAATVLGGTVDTLKNLKAAARGRITAGDALGKILSSFVAQGLDKTSLRGAADLQGILAGEKPLDRFTADRIGAIMPNILKQAVRESDPVFREKPDDFMEMLARAVWPRGGPAAMDVYGEAQDKKGTSASRILDFTDFGGDDAQPYDAMLWRYKQKNPDPKVYYAPQAPSTSYTVGGVDKQMTAAQAARFKEAAGKRTLVRLKATPLNLTDPKETDIKRFRDAVDKGRDDARKILFKSPSWQNLK